MTSSISKESLQDVVLDPSKKPIGDDGNDDDVSKSSDNENTPTSLPVAGFSAKWTAIVNGFHVPILMFLQAVTSKAASSPRRTIAGVVSLSLFLFVVGILTNFTVDVDEDILWTPQNSRPVKHAKWIDNESGFPAEPRPFFMLFHSEGTNVLGQNQVDRIFQALDAVRTLEQYESVCSESAHIDVVTGLPTCELSGVTAFWNDTATVFQAQVTSDADAIEAMSSSKYPDGTPVSEQSVFGYLVRSNNGDRLLESAQSYAVRIDLPDTDAAESFESKALDVLLDMADEWQVEDGNVLRLEVAAERSFDDEFDRAIVNDIPLVPIVFVIMSIFTCLVFMKRDKVRSRSLLGFGAVMAVFLSIMSGYGLLFITGTPFTSMTQILPFVIFGVGLDDAFILSGSYLRSDATKTPEARIRETVNDVGVSITLTTVTSTLAFGLGCISTIPAVYWLCMYAFPTMMFVYLYQITFFVACIVLDERRIQQNRRDCCTWVTVDSGGGGDNGKDENAQIEAVTNAGHNNSSQEPFVERMMGLYAKQLLRPWVKVAVVIAFSALAGVCAYSASKLEQQFRFTDVLPSGSYAAAFFEAQDDYTASSDIAPFVYFRSVDQSNESIQEQMERYVNDLVSVDAIDATPKFFWLLDFKLFLNQSDDTVTSLDFNLQVDAFLADSVYGELYRDDIVQDESGIVTASRCAIKMDNLDIEDVKQQIDALEQQRAVTKAQAINQRINYWNFFTHDGIYNIWEFYSVSVSELIVTTVIGVVAVTSVAFIFVPHWTAAIFILPLISVLYVDLLGVMQWAGLHVNAVSYISLVLSIGLQVDFVMHVLLRYYESTGTRQQKTVEMLKTMGASILVGGISTFLGTLPLAFSSSVIFNTIFIAFLGLVSLGCGHGLILLPVILSMIGPEDQITLEGKSLKHHETTATTPVEDENA